MRGNKFFMCVDCKDGKSIALDNQKIIFPKFVLFSRLNYRSLDFCSGGCGSEFRLSGSDPGEKPDPDLYSEYSQIKAL